jgi:hypothetical protein
MVQGSEIALSGLPASCEASAKDESGKVCISCDRSTSVDSKKVSFKGLCFQAPQDFDRKIHCGFEGQPASPKSIFCKSVTGDKTDFDLSLANEKALDILPFVLTALKLALADHLKANPVHLAVANSIVEFSSIRIKQVLEGKNLDAIAEDVLNFSSQFYALPMTPAEAASARALGTIAIHQIYERLSTKQSYSVGESIALVLKVAQAIPEKHLGTAKPYLSKEKIAELLELNKTSLDPIISTYGAVLGISSADDLIKEIRAAAD